MSIRSGKFNLDWHRQCLTNQKIYLARQEAELKILAVNLDSTRDSVKFYETQIAEAERLGLTAFDPNKFRKKSKVKTAK